MLTDRECRTAKGGEKPQKLSDAHGLYLYVSKTGHKSWRLKFRVSGREKILTFGPYPALKLAEARAMSQQARDMLRNGQDPTRVLSVRGQRERITRDLSRSFEKVARDWQKLQAPQWKARHAEDVLASLENNLFPTLGARDLADIRAQDLVALLQKVQQRGAAETAFRLLQRISAIYRYARACELVAINPAESVADALQPVIKRRRRAQLSLDKARAFLKAYEAEPGWPSTKLASRLLALTAARPGMVRMAQACEFEDLDGSEPIWRVPAAKMKLKLAESEQEAFDFIIPLFRCIFLDDSQSMFPFALMRRCMVDSWEAWKRDYQPYDLRPFGQGEVWIGYDPNASESATADDAALVVVAPPAKPGGKFRILEKQRLKGLDFEGQANAIRSMAAKYNVTKIGIDTTGAGRSVHQLVAKWFPMAQAYHYSVPLKTAMVLKAKNIISNGRLEFDTGWIDVVSSFMAIKPELTSKGMTYTASRAGGVGHADVAWAVMHALFFEPLDGGESGQSSMEIF